MFASLGKHRYLLVGMGDADLVHDREDVIVARFLPDNIERYPDLLSFTGWYAVARNELATTPCVALLEHDVRLSPDFEPRTLDALRDRRAMAGYVPVRLTNPMYLHATPWLMTSLSTTYGIDVSNLVREHLARGEVDRWTATSNHALWVDDLAAFVEWFLPLSVSFRDDPLGSGVHERAVPVFCLLRGIADRYVPGVLDHHQVASHGFVFPPYEEAQRRADASMPLLTPAGAFSRLLEADLALAEQTAHSEALRSALAKQTAISEALRQALAEQTARAESVERMNGAILGSRSWRVMGPARLVGRLARRVAGLVVDFADRLRA